MEISLDKVLVFPKLLNLGLYVKDLFIDLSATGATNFSASFPQAYDPAWKGVGAKEITFIFLVDIDEQEFIVAGVGSFLYGFDGLFSGKLKFLYTNSEENKLIKEADIHLEIRRNEIAEAIEAAPSFVLVLSPIQSTPLIVIRKSTMPSNITNVSSP